MKKLSIIAVLITVLIFVLSGCLLQNRDELTIHIFLDLSDEDKEKVEEALEAGMKELGLQDIAVEMSINRFSRELIIAELATSAADVFIAHEIFMEPMLIQGGLISMEVLYENREIPEKVLNYQTDLVKDDEVIGTGIYGLPIDEETPFFKNIGVSFDAPLLAVLPELSPYKEDAIQVLQLFTP